MDTKFRTNYDLYTKCIASKQNGSPINKTIYAKKLGLISYNSNDIVIEVLYTDKEAKERISKLLNDFFENEEQLELNKHKINYINDYVKNEFLITCDKDLYIEKSGIKFIDEENFTQSVQFIDDNHIPLRIDSNQFRRVLEEKSRRTKGEDSVISKTYIVQKQKITFTKIISGIIDMIPTISDFQI